MLNQDLAQLNLLNYQQAEQQFNQLLETEDLDKFVSENPKIVRQFEGEIEKALKIAYSQLPETETTRAHLLLQRILYQINRLNLFWYDDLQHYKNERSFYLQKIRNSIEKAWQKWELSQFDIAEIKQKNVKETLIEWGEADLNPPLNEHRIYLREQITLKGYRHLLMIASVDGLVEASRLSRIIGGASNEIQATLIRVLLEEYGNGRLKRKHSTFFAQMMSELNLNTEPESYLEILPWEVLACINQNFLLTECKRYFLRYNGGLTYFEIAGPSIYEDYMMAAQRNQLTQEAMGYWELHIREDERHGQWMLQEVALPLADKYPENAWELLLGYEQEKKMGARAGAAVVKAIKQVEQREVEKSLVISH